ncbi:hypothetical protein [Microbacterium sp. PAMC21962]|uniref:hypothetical protein n=1 Tax=Microbacterium sp. PAMC21962 TaxID=2861280 RepID=UPI001C638FC0|nr:hypothetical protein [Microbacterium sp. PAMC21962]QYF97094.1 hypothetical protein KY498_13130 [Microbacterium sp. PAMC21962]
MLPGVAGLEADEEAFGEPSAGWTQDEGQFVFLTYGSSSCVPVVEDIAATGAAEVTITFAEPEPNQVCTMDFAPRAAVGWVEGLESTTEAELVLTGGAEFPDVRIPIYGSN